MTYNQVLDQLEHQTINRAREMLTVVDYKAVVQVAKQEADRLAERYPEKNWEERLNLWRKQLV